jgi:hypothetical protein
MFFAVMLTDQFDGSLAAAQENSTKVDPPSIVDLRRYTHGAGNYLGHSTAFGLGVCFCDRW